MLKSTAFQSRNNGWVIHLFTWAIHFIFIWRRDFKTNPTMLWISSKCQTWFGCFFFRRRTEPLAAYSVLKINLRWEGLQRSLAAHHAVTSQLSLSLGKLNFYVKLHLRYQLWDNFVLFFLEGFNIIRVVVYRLMNSLCVQEVINQRSGWNTKSHFKQEQEKESWTFPRPATEVTWVYVQGMCNTLISHTHYMGFEVLKVCYPSGQWEERPQTCLDILKLQHCCSLPSFLGVFKDFFPPSEETVLFLLMPPPFKAPALLSEAECWWSSGAPRCCWAAELVWFHWIMK